MSSALPEPSGVVPGVKGGFLSPRVRPGQRRAGLPGAQVFFESLGTEDRSASQGGTLLSQRLEWSRWLQQKWWGVAPTISEHVLIVRQESCLDTACDGVPSPRFWGHFDGETDLRQPLGGIVLQNLVWGIRDGKRAQGMWASKSGSLELASDFVTYQLCDLGELLSFWSFSFLNCKQEIILNCLPFENRCENSAWHTKYQLNGINTEIDSNLTYLCDAFYVPGTVLSTLQILSC